MRLGRTIQLQSALTVFCNEVRGKCWGRPSDYRFVVGQRGSAKEKTFHIVGTSWAFSGRFCGTSSIFTYPSTPL